MKDRWETLWKRDLHVSDIQNGFQKMIQLCGVSKEDKTYDWLTRRWCRKMMKCIDEIWCQGILFKDHKVKLRVYMSSKKRHVFDKREITSVAAMVINEGLRQKLYVNDILFRQLFITEEYYYIFGMMVKTRIESVLHILLHEYIHIFLNIARYYKIYHWKHDHGPEFMHKVNKWYGHTDYEVGLIPGFQSNQLMTEVKIGDKVKVFICQKTHVIGIIIQKENNRISVTGELFPERSKVSLKTHIGRIVSKC